MQTKCLPEAYDCLAPDGSQIRILAATENREFRALHAPCGRGVPGRGASLGRRDLVLHPGTWTGLAQTGRSGAGRRRLTGNQSEHSRREPAFQFRSLADEPLEFLLTTMPPWPGDDEAYRVEDYWPLADG